MSYSKDRFGNNYRNKSDTVDLMVLRIREVGKGEGEGVLITEPVTLAVANRMDLQFQVVKKK